MNTAISSQHAAPRVPVLGWLAAMVSGLRWGHEMRRRYDAERSAGRQPDGETIRRLADEVDAWLGRRT